MSWTGHPLRVLGRLPEPAAVAIDYLHYMQHIAPEDIRLKEDRFTVLVYDLGHGTFDTAVVTAQSKGSPYQLHAKNGLPEVGGKDFDRLLYEEFCRQLLEQYDYAPKNERDRQKILQAAIQAKFELTDGENSVQQILVKGEYLEVEVTQARFEELSQHLMFQTLELVQNVLEESEANDITVQGIVLSGGASKMPMVKRNLEAMVEGAMPVVLYRPSEAVSYGAARSPMASSRRRSSRRRSRRKRPLPQCCPSSQPGVGAVHRLRLWHLDGGEASWTARCASWWQRQQPPAVSHP